MARILHSLFGFSVAVNGLAPCYYPEGVTIEPGHVPCNQTISGASACCDPLDSCSVSGYCLGRSGWDYRGSCTDQSWSSPDCANAQSSCLTGTHFSLLSSILYRPFPGKRRLTLVLLQTHQQTKNTPASPQFGPVPTHPEHQNIHGVAPKATVPIPAAHLPSHLSSPAWLSCLDTINP